MQLLREYPIFTGFYMNKDSPKNFAIKRPLDALLFDESIMIPFQFLITYEFLARKLLLLDSNQYEFKHGYENRRELIL